MGGALLNRMEEKDLTDIWIFNQRPKGGVGERLDTDP